MKHRLSAEIAASHWQRPPDGAAGRQRSWPATEMIDETGCIRYKHIGEFDEQWVAKLEQVIEAFVAEPGPGA